MSEVSPVSLASGLDEAATARLSARPGHLYIVATPIGNLADLSDRARLILATVDLIACEDTRTTSGLLARIGLHRPLLPYHDYNELMVADQLTARLREGNSIALVSDAGTPAISDPGFRVVRACRRAALPVVAVPGACALVAVLSASGLPTDGFLFVGFLPAKTSARIAFLEKYRDFDYTLALYESCHRIAKFMAEITASLGPTRIICLAKEVTKLHETWLVGPAAEVEARLAKTSLKGEFVLLIAPADFAL
jgi:16S rRNA (cytidine1402-2'-O)-methyltransferase